METLQELIEWSKYECLKSQTRHQGKVILDTTFVSEGLVNKLINNLGRGVPNVFDLTQSGSVSTKDLLQMLSGKYEAPPGIDFAPYTPSFTFGEGNTLFQGEADDGIVMIWFRRTPFDEPGMTNEQYQDLNTFNLEIVLDTNHVIVRTYVKTR